MKIFYDMDGVLADFNIEKNGVERFASEKGFFKKLKPLPLVERLKAMDNVDSIFILTSSPHEQADNDKIEWVKEHLPKLADKVITVRSGKEKAKYAKGNILVDDYTENLKEWTKKGGIAIKALNGENGKTERYLKVAVDTINAQQGVI